MKRNPPYNAYNYPQLGHKMHTSTPHLPTGSPPGPARFPSPDPQAHTPLIVCLPALLPRIPLTLLARWLYSAPRDLIRRLTFSRASPRAAAMPKLLRTLNDATAVASWNT